MENKVYYEEDAIGKHKVIEKPNGIKIRILKEPSREYVKKMQERKIKNKENMIKQNNKIEEERMIKEEMRKQAIESLKAQGKL